MNITESLGKKGLITLRGWVQELRDLKKIKFIILRDKTGVLQVLLKEESDELKKVFESLTKEDYIEVKGTLKESNQAKLGKEMIPERIKIVSKSEQPFPIDISGKIESGLDIETDWKFLHMRNTKILHIFQLQSEIVKSMSNFLDKQKFTRIFSSKLVNAPTEGGADYFEVKYFDKKAFLAQSPQFYKELALASGIDKVYEVGMAYRAEPHNTSRHLCEYASFDFEMVCNNMEVVMKLEEKMLKKVVKDINKNAKDILVEYNTILDIPSKIPRIKFADAKQIVEKIGIKTEEGDLTHTGEKALGEWAKKEHNSDFVFLTHFPFKEKVFYTKKKGKESLSFDLLYKGVEITSGGIREENPEKRAKNAKIKGLDPAQFDHLRFFKYSMPPHGGLAIGIERITQLMLNLGNIREASLTPRDPDRLTP